MRILIIVGTIVFLGYLTNLIMRRKNRIERGGAEYIADDSRWAGDRKNFGRNKEYAIVVSNPETYMDSLVDEKGRHVTWKKFQEFDVTAENYEYETLTIAAYGIFAGDEYLDKLYFYCGGLRNSRNVPDGYRIEKPSKPGSTQMNFCPYCGKELEEGIYFCTHCGKQIKEREEKSENTIAADEFDKLNKRLDELKEMAAKREEGEI
ncbi:MAG: zinc-ribbon domain-containing protein [Clostridiales bacterium]|nr:zinc-ribbon domain-containing protein [Clostridiales bacterium]MCI7619338.1 zinc-ribbon domain-containing protein [Bacillota bacterium]MDD7036126.1 zinc-ribbon domain-containing protein [Bacillota bacterium]MDY2920147.1 zinc-ribbon domain-containing protein [Lentihominibacter sp.]